MVGTKVSSCVTMVTISLEKLVPQDHFYRQLDQGLDLSLVRQFVHETHASGGRPSIDPVVFFILQLVMFFVGDTLGAPTDAPCGRSARCALYFGYDLNKPFPDHSSLTPIRERYGVDVFRRFFDAIVEQCQQEKLI